MPYAIQSDCWCNHLHIHPSTDQSLLFCCMTEILVKNEAANQPRCALHPCFRQMADLGRYLRWMAGLGQRIVIPTFTSQHHACPVETWKHTCMQRVALALAGTRIPHAVPAHTTAQTVACLQVHCEVMAQVVIMYLMLVYVFMFGILLLVPRP